MKKINFSFILGFILYVIGFYLAFISITGNIRQIIDLPSFMFIVIPLLGILIVTKSFKVFGRGFKAVLLLDAHITDEICEQTASFFRFLSRATVIIIIVGFLISVMSVLFRYDFSADYAIIYFNRNMAVILILPVYGLILIGGLFEPIVFNLKKRCRTNH